MARKGKDPQDEKENTEQVLALKKNPVRMGPRRKAAATDELVDTMAPRTRQAKTATSAISRLDNISDEMTVRQPLSPKKINGKTTRSRKPRENIEDEFKASNSVTESIKPPQIILDPTDIIIDSEEDEEIAVQPTMTVPKLKKGRSNTSKPVRDDGKFEQPGSRQVMKTDDRHDDTTGNTATNEIECEAAEVTLINEHFDLNKSELSSPASAANTSQRLSRIGTNTDQLDHAESSIDQGSLAPFAHDGANASRKSLRGTPVENKTLDLPLLSISKSSRTGYTSVGYKNLAKKDIEIVELSEDELCGPVTPFFSRKKTEQSRVRFAGENSPMDDGQMITNSDHATSKKSNHCKAEEDERVASLIEQDSSVTLDEASFKEGNCLRNTPRLMPTPKGSCVQYVYHPFPKASGSSSPLKGSYQWPTTAEEEEEDNVDPLDSTITTITSVASSRRSTRSSVGSGTIKSASRKFFTGQKSTLKSQKLVQLFTSQSDEDESEDDNSDESLMYEKDADELPYTPRFPKVNTNGERDEFENSAYSLDESVLSDHDLSIVPSFGSVVISPAAKPNNEEGDELEWSTTTPHLRSSIMRSSISPSTPSINNSILMSSIDEQDMTAPSFNIGNKTNRPRVSFNLESEMSTPHTSNNSKISTLPLRTPRMQAPLADPTNVTRHGLASMTKDDSPLCIDPSVLSNLQIMPTDSPRRSSVQINDIYNDDFVFGPESPQIVSPPEQNNALNLPFRLEDFVEISPVKGARSNNTNVSNDQQPEDVDNSVIIHSISKESQDQAVILGKDLFAPVEVKKDEDELPHYARSTMSYDARRKSMPFASVGTPQLNIMKPRNAETVLRPRASQNFAQLLLGRNGQRPSTPTGNDSPSRRQSMMSLTSSPGRASPTPRSLPRSTSSLGLRKHASTRTLRQSFVQDEAFPSQINTPLTPRPRCYTPTQPFEQIRAASVCKNRPDVKSSTVSPKKKVRISPKKSTPSKSIVSPNKRTPMTKDISTQAAFTPHPSAPLKGITAYVEVFTQEGSDASVSFIATLHRLGAKTAKTFTADRVSHVIFKNGSPSLLQKIRIANKSCQKVHCVNSRWIVDCDRLGQRLSEDSSDYAIDISSQSTPALRSHRRQKSWEPHVLVKSNDRERGNMTINYEKRESIASSTWGESPIKADQNLTSLRDDSVVEDDSWLESTPVPIRRELEVERVVPGSVPVQRVRKFDMDGFDNVDRRRLTAWDERND